MSVVLNAEFAGKTREIRTRVTLSYSIPLSDVGTPAVVCEALWDTGADSSAVSKKAATAILDFRSAFPPRDAQRSHQLQKES